MTGEKYTFETARLRLEEIAVEVRKKDTSLEKSLDLLEEGVRLANVCTELVDHTEVFAAPSSVGRELDGAARGLITDGGLSAPEAVLDPDGAGVAVIHADAEGGVAVEEAGSIPESTEPVSGLDV